MTKISSGLSLPALMKLGMVESLDGVEIGRGLRNDIEQRRVFIRGLYTVGVGFGPKVLEMVQEGAIEEIMQWVWLHESADTIF